MIKRIFKQSGIHFGGSLLGKIFATTAYILLSWYIVPEQYGQGILSVTIILLSTVIGDYGLRQWYQKQEREEESFVAYSKIRIILGIIIAILTFVITYYLNWLPLSLNIITSIAIVPYALLSIANSYLVRAGQVMRLSMWQIVQTMPIFLVIILLKHDLTLETVFTANLIGVSGAVMILFPWRKLKKLSQGSVSLYQVLRSSSKYALLNYTSVTYARADSILVRNYLGSAALGFYGLAYRYLEYFALFPSSLVQILFPIFAQNKVVTARTIFKLTLLVGLIGLFFSLILAMIAPLLILKLHGTAYAPSVPVLQILSGTLILFFVNAPLSTFVQASDMVKKFLPFGIANTVLNVVLNILTIPALGIIGAAVTMLITEMTGLLINIYFAHKILRQNK